MCMLQSWVTRGPALLGALVWGPELRMLMQGLGSVSVVVLFELCEHLGM